MRSTVIVTPRGEEDRVLDLSLIDEEIRGKRTVYHYTTRKAYELILTGAFFRNKPGLRPLSSFIQESIAPKLPRKAYRNVTYAFLEKRPDQWVKGDGFPYLWRGVMSNLSKLPDEKGLVTLLSLDLEKHDKAFVVDRSLAFNPYRNGNPTTRQLENAFHDYWNSRVPLFEYQGGYYLPEVVIFSRVNLKKINEIWTRPLHQAIRRP